MIVNSEVNENNKKSDNSMGIKCENGMMRIALAFLLVLVGLCSLVSYQLYLNIQKLIVDELGRNAMNVAITTAKFIEQDIEAYANLSKAEDYTEGNYDESYYKKMQLVFQNIKKETGVTFIFTQKMLSETEVAYIIDGEDPQSEWFSPIGSVDTMGELEFLVFNEGIVGATDILEWEYWGKFLTGYAPITDFRTGNIVGLVGVDFSLDYVNNILNKIRSVIIGTTVLIVLLGTFLSHKLLRDKFTALNRDYLTELYSKRYHDMKLNMFIKKARNTKKALSLMMIDIDFFKEINDQYGHDVGDKILQYVAQKIKLYTRSHDICSRFGGDEFMVILPDTNLEQGEIIANRILGKLNDESDLNEIIKGIDDFDISLSIGIAEWHEGISPEQLTHFADTAMYLAKEKGRNRVNAYGAV